MKVQRQRGHALKRSFQGAAQPVMKRTKPVSVSSEPVHASWVRWASWALTVGDGASPLITQDVGRTRVSQDGGSSRKD